MENTKLLSLLELGSKEKMFTLSSDEKNKIEDGYRLLMSYLENSKNPVYGIHTGYGSNVLSERSGETWKINQRDLLDYLSVGVGKNLPEAVVRRALRLQIQKVSQGYSGIHPETVQKLVTLCNSATLPNVPCFGSLGASGDLIPMAHAIAPIFAEGSEPLSPRDVIGLVNTNSMMSSYAIECWRRVSKIVHSAHAVTALVMRAVGADEDPVSARVSSLRPASDGYSRSAEMLRGHLQNMAKIGLVDKKWLQPRYSIRCSPMVLGNVLDLLQFAEEKIISDAESVADNPVMFEVEGEAVVHHAGLFYAASTATAADAMNDVLGKVSEMLDRQVLLLMDPNLSEGLSENLAVSGAGHLKGIHQMVSGLNQQLRALSTPSRSLSFSCEGNNQDIVPCAMAALNQLDAAVEVAEEVVRASLFVALRAYQLRCGEAISDSLFLKNWNQFQVSEFEVIFKKDKKQADIGPTAACKNTKGEGV